MKKKNYEKPQIQVIEVDQTDIICASPLNYSTTSPSFDPYSEEELN